MCVVCVLKVGDQAELQLLQKFYLQNYEYYDIIGHDQNCVA